MPLHVPLGSLNEVMNPQHFALLSPSLAESGRWSSSIANHPVGAVLMAVTLGLMVWSRPRQAGKKS